MNRPLVAVSFIAFTTSLFVRTVDPVVPQIAGEFGMPAADVALLATAFALPFAVLQPVLGPLADAFGKTKLMMIGTAILIAATVAGAFANNFTWLLVTRIIAGAATGAIFPAGLAFVADSVSADRRQVVLARYVTAALAGNLSGAWVGGVVGDFTNWRGVLIAAALCGVAAFATGLWGFRNVKHEHGPRFDIAFAMNNYRRIFSNTRAKYCYLGVLLEGTAIYGIFPFVAVLLHQSGESRATIAGFVIAGFAIGGAVFGVFVTPIMNLLSTRGMMICGSLLTAAALCISTLRLHWPYEFAAFMLMGLGFYMMHNCFQVAVSEIAPTARGSAIALHSSFFFIGQAIGPVFYYWSLANAGIGITLAAAAVIIAITGIIGAQTLFPRQNSVSS